MDAIIVMAGKGTRLNAGINKVLLDLNGKPIFMHSVELLKKFADRVILVINPADEAIIKEYITKDVLITYGGKERYLSVLNGMKLALSDKVIIHDAARANVNPTALAELIEYSNDYDALMLTQTEKNTSYLLEDNCLVPLDRAKMVLAATPQIVDRKLYMEASIKALETKYLPTDDISLLLRFNPKLKVKCVNDEGNFKITTASDLELARMVKKDA